MSDDFAADLSTPAPAAPTTPEAVSPDVITSLLDSKTVETPATSILDEIEPPIVDEAEQTATGAPPDATAQKIKDLGDAVGYDLSRFSTVEAAEAAADMVYERFAQMGGSGDIAAALQPPVAQEPAAVEPEDLGLDETTVDPAVLAVLKKLNSKNAELTKQFADTKANEQRQQVQNVVKVVEQKAETFLDSLDTPVFGKVGKRTVAQNAAAEVVGKIAGKLLTGMISEARANGRTNLPPIERIMEWAVKQSGFSVTKKPTGAAPIAKPYSLQPKSPVGGMGSVSASMPRVSSQNDPQNIFSSKDPTVQAIWAETMRRING